MSYQVIARKWRPQSFDQVVGQSHISQTLGNALKNDRLPHALLFTGPRGTGKTSSARILAKSLRCPNAVNFVPCNQCPSCEEISLGRSVDVIEIDGASNNGVDAIRELRDTVAYAPSSGKYKVYIIDEVHMLSTSAFNALLKTLEEPPEHVIFIMATTEVHKIPQTILSRCQRFDFRSIPTKKITEHLRLICEREGVKAEEEALWIIARQGDGSMRDSQSLLDQVITFANGALTRATVVDILGLTDRTLLLETLSALVNRDTAAILKVLEKLTTTGFDPTLFANDLLENLRNLLLIKISSDNKTLIIELPDSEITFLESLGNTLSEEDIHMLFDMGLKSANDIARSDEPKLVLEMALLRMALAPKVESIARILSGAVPSQTSATSAPLTAPRVGMSAPAPAAPTPVSRKVDPLSMNPQERWYNFVQKVRDKDALFAAKIENLLFLSEKNKVLELAIPAKLAFLKNQMTDSAVKETLLNFVKQEFGTEYSFQVQLSKEESQGTSAQALAQQKEKQKEDEVAKQVAEHPLVKSATVALKGQIKSIKATDRSNT